MLRFTLAAVLALMVMTRGANGWRIRHIHWSSRAPN